MNIFFSYKKIDVKESQRVKQKSCTQEYVEIRVRRPGMFAGRRGATCRFDLRRSLAYVTWSPYRDRSPLSFSRARAFVCKTHGSPSEIF